MLKLSDWAPVAYLYAMYGFAAQPWHAHPVRMCVEWPLGGILVQQHLCVMCALTEK